MKTLRIFWSLMLILSLTLTAACENKQPDTPGASSTISLKASIVEASGDGGEYSINYTITNPVEGGVISAMTTANWIGKWNTDEAGKITFTVAPNNSNEPREAVVEVAGVRRGISSPVSSDGLSLLHAVSEARRRKQASRAAVIFFINLAVMVFFTSLF